MKGFNESAMEEFYLEKLNIADSSGLEAWVVNHDGGDESLCVFPGGWTISVPTHTIAIICRRQSVKVQQLLAFAQGENVDSIFPPVILSHEEQTREEELLAELNNLQDRLLKGGEDPRFMLAIQIRCQEIIRELKALTEGKDTK